MFRLCLYTFTLPAKKQNKKRAYFEGFKIVTIFYNSILSGMFYQARSSGVSLGLVIMGDGTVLEPPES